MLLFYLLHKDDYNRCYICFKISQNTTFQDPMLNDSNIILFKRRKVGLKTEFVIAFY